MHTSEIYYLEKLPQVSEITETSDQDDVLLIYDEHFDEMPSVVRQWIKKFVHRYAVKSGEQLKDLHKFPQHVQNINKIVHKMSPLKMQIVVLGGGSVGDFAAFFASVYKRGVQLTLIPSTWLSAIDSSHGGKTALNLNQVKNQLGTFYPAQKIFIVQQLLLAQPPIRALEAYGEMFKIALIAGGSLWKGFSQKAPAPMNLWNFLPQAIEAKYKIIRQDPYEKRGIRSVLNLGHTMGHVFETRMQMPHGMAVNYGIHFALEWSLHRQILSQKNYQSIVGSVSGEYLLSPVDAGLFAKGQIKHFQSVLEGDKKRTDKDSIRFIFCRKPGSILVESVLIKDIIEEIKRQAR